MNAFDEKIDEWVKERIPISGILSDYQLLIGDNNRVLSNIPRALAVGASPTFPANKNRVALVLNANLSAVPTGAASCFVQFLDATGASVYLATLFAKEADVATLTPSPFYYQPLIFNIRDFGPLIQYSYQIQNGAGFNTVMAVETIYTPIRKDCRCYS